MAQAMRTTGAPISLNQSCGPEQERRSVNLLLKHYERSVAGIAIIGALLISAVGMLLDYSVTLFHWPWLKESAIENTIEGAWFGLLIWAFLNARNKHLQQRLNE